MSNTALLISVAVLGPVVTFAVARVLLRAIDLSGSPRGAQFLALGVAGGVQGFVLAFSIAAHGFAWQTIATLIASTVFTGLGWSRFRQSFPAGSRPSAGAS